MYGMREIFMIPKMEIPILVPSNWKIKIPWRSEDSLGFPSSAEQIPGQDKY
jgi:hypothetical protein